MREELYDIRADIGEAHDLAAVAAHAATLRELRAELDSWLAATHARLPSPDPGEKTRLLAPFLHLNDHFTKTGSGPT
jgi:hypothetical protein